MRTQQHAKVHLRLEIYRDLLVRRFPRLGLRKIDATLNAGVVHQNVELRKFANRPFGERHPLRRHGNVAGAGVDARMLGLELSELVLAASADDHVASAADKSFRQRESDSGSSSGDEYRMRGEIHQRSSLDRLASSSIREALCHRQFDAFSLDGAEVQGSPSRPVRTSATTHCAPPDER